MMLPKQFPRPPAKFTIPMKHQRLEWCLQVIGWSRGELARRLDVSETTAKTLVNGKRNIPANIAVWLETLASMHLALPAPHFWHENADVGALRHKGEPLKVSENAEGFEATFAERAPTPAQPWGEAGE
jgi:hypothetical protein